MPVASCGPGIVGGVRRATAMPVVPRLQARARLCMRPHVSVVVFCCRCMHVYARMHASACLSFYPCVPWVRMATNPANRRFGVVSLTDRLLIPLSTQYRMPVYARRTGAIATLGCTMHTHMPLRALCFALVFLHEYVLISTEDVSHGQHTAGHHRVL